jgi:oligopeptide/dipeptide ABC transporter ATP-binding protein
MALLEVSDLKVHFPVRGGVFRRALSVCKAVDGVSLKIEPGETLGLVGESGCGKSTLGRTIVRLITPTAGNIRFEGTDMAHLPQRELKPIRRDMQMIFQDPAESLNSRLTIGDIVEEPYIIHRIGTRAERRKWVAEVLERVGLQESAMHRFPFEFSGGQRQRIGIARALTLKPKLIVCDEAVSALDVSIQSQILNLLLELQRDMKISYLFIAHDLAVVKHMSDRIAVMYLGKIVELGDGDEIHRNPRHAYTRALLSSIPVVEPGKRERRAPLKGDVPSPINPPEGSAFGHRIGSPRYAETIGKELQLKEIEPGHWVAHDPCCLSDEDYRALS